MNIFRRASSPGLAGLLIAAAASAALTAAVAVSAFAGSGSLPPAAPLDQALEGALSAAPPAGISADVTFTNHLFDSGGLAAIASLIGSPLLTGGSGHIWVSSGGAFRVELPGSSGTAEIVGDGTKLSAYVPMTNTDYVLTLPAAASQPATSPPSLSEIDAALAALGRYASISSATPATVAGQPAYTVTVTPDAPSGLVGSASLSFDAATGVPLDLALEARGSSSPVLELAVTDISYAAVPPSEVEFSPPSGTKIVTVSPPSRPAGATPPSPVTDPAAVARALPFTLVAPTTLGGLSRQTVRLVGKGSSAGALVSYGSGLGAVLVFEQSAAATSAAAAALDLLPSVPVGSTSGHELSTPLGTVLAFDAGGVSFALVGSLSAVSAEADASSLAS
jgi:outer membrane lipoprotein-sorting protein